MSMNAYFSPGRAAEIDNYFNILSAEFGV